MSLEATGVEPIERGMSAGFSLPMRDGERTVTVIVTHEALKAFDAESPDAQETLRIRRADVETAARLKYERGEIASNGRILILPRDLNL